MSKTPAWVVAEQEARAARADGPDDRDYKLDVMLRALRMIASGELNEVAHVIARETLNAIEPPPPHEA